MFTMNSHSIEISLAGCVGEMVRRRWFVPFSFFTFFYYNAFIVFRYKKLRAALAMERTNPINQKQNTKETKFLIPPHYCK